MSLTFNEILKYNYQNLKNSLSSFDLNTRFQMLFKLTNTQNLKELDKFFMDMKKQAKIKDTFSDLNIDIKKDIKKIINDINAQRLANNPVRIDLEDINKILLNKQ